MTTTLIAADLPATSGAPGVTQGAYGDAGNLELVVPAPDEGLWVFWFNADPVDRRQGAGRWCWSGGLHVAGPPAASARIAQMSAGPNYLEVFAAGDAGLSRWYWTPDDGFVAAGIVCEAIMSSAPVEFGGAVHALAVREDGELAQLRAPLAGYPHLVWSSRSLGIDAVRAELAIVAGQLVAAVTSAGGRVQLLTLGQPSWGWAADGDAGPGWSRAVPIAGGVIGLDHDGHVRLDWGDGSSRLWLHVVATELSAADTTLDDGRVDMVLRCADGLLRHAHGRGGSWSAPQPIRSQVWTSSPGLRVHRRG